MEENITTIKIRTSTMQSVVYCGKGSFEKVTDILQGHQNFLLTDSNVYRLYKEVIEKTFYKVPIYILEAGEESKNFSSLQKILTAMINAQLHRNSYLFALGGGVVGDIGGLAASLYMRGIQCIQIPTTLLAQVDSSVGGKTAVDMGSVKNVVGAFYQPQQVIVDPMFLTTLPAREIRCGLGEIIKTGGLNGKIFDILQKNIKNLTNLNFLASLIPLCIQHKANVVEKDEKETTGLRASLNMGHTTGHALELYYKDRSHGEFVLIGMFLELQIAKRLKLVEQEYAFELEKMILGVIEDFPMYGKEIENALEYAKLDKKNNTSEKISMIIPEKYDKYQKLTLEFEEYKKYILNYFKL